MNLPEAVPEIDADSVNLWEIKGVGQCLFYSPVVWGKSDTLGDF